MERSTIYQYRQKKTRAREIVLLALLTALVVIADVVCANTVPLHLGTALVILTGASLGKKAGGLTGAMAMLISNNFLGQGVWTPFQMLAMGLLGFFAGCFFCRAEGNAPPERAKRRTALIAAYTFFAVLIVYGGIMNFLTWISYGLMMGTSEGLSLAGLLARYASGVPYDISHGGCAAACVLLLERRFSQKLERIRLKYGFYR